MDTTLPRAPQFNARKVVEHFGSAASLCALLGAAGHHVSLDAVKKWKSRNSMTLESFLWCQVAADAVERPITFEQFVTKGTAE